MSEDSSSSAAVVIGSGFGGIAAAIRLQARGYQVSLLEMRDQPGGRAYVYRQDGFTFDAGPTIVTAPFLIDELFALGGRRAEDYVRLVPCHPFYRIVFHDGRTFRLHGRRGGDRRADQTLQPGRRARLPAFRRAFAGNLRPRLHGPRGPAVYPVLGHGENRAGPRAPAVGSIGLPTGLGIHQRPVPAAGLQFSSAVDRRQSVPVEFDLFDDPLPGTAWGVHFAMGGTGAIVDGLLRLFAEMGGTLHLNTRVTEITTDERGAATGVRVADGQHFPARVVVSNGDVANTYRRMLPASRRRKWTDKRLERMKYSMGLFVVYFGTDRTYPHLAHHTIILTQRYRELLHDIFNRKHLAEDFSLYLHAPTRTDPSLAPPGGECFYVLAPVPNLLGKTDWEQVKERYADTILASLEQPELCPDLRKHIVTQRILTPLDFETELDAFRGSAFQFEPILTQSAWFRPHNVSEDVPGLYFAGAGTHPGAGLPGVLSSAKLLDRVVPAPR